MEKGSNTAERLKHLMSYYDMTQVALSQKTNIPKSTLSMYISGEREPKQNRIVEIADKFDISEVWLMGYDVPMKRDSEEDISDYMVDIIYDNFLIDLTKHTKQMTEMTKERLLRYAKFLLEEQEDA